MSVKEYDYTTEALSEDYTEKTYTYNTSIRDRLDNFNGHSITYNAMGCPTSFNGFDATWTRGKLSELSRQGTEIGYEYNAFGQRIRKNISYAMGGVTGYEFCYDTSGRLICERKYSENGTAIDKLVYLYDENTIIGVDYTANGATNTYFFQRNLLGDVIGIYDSNRVQVGKYKYDAWGNCTTTLDATGIAYRNPIRYRGYYYDTESGLYYLNARYYNPEWRRFISPDDTGYLDPESVNGLNLYCYCGNDPVNYCDPTGHSWESFWNSIGGKIIGTVLVIGAMVALSIATAGVGTAVVTALGSSLGAAIAGGAIGGAISGAIWGTGISMISQGITNGYSNIDYEKVAIDGLIGMASGAAIGAAFAGIGRGLGLLGRTKWAQRTLSKFDNSSKNYMFGSKSGNFTFLRYGKNFRLESSIQHGLHYHSLAAQTTAEQWEFIFKISNFIAGPIGGGVANAIY